MGGATDKTWGALSAAEYLDHYLLQEESGIAPKRSVRAALPGWTLCFDAVGGAASVVPLDSPEAAMFPMFADGVHGVPCVLGGAEN